MDCATKTNTGLRIEDNWCRHLPLLHRIIADPSLKGSFPVLTERCDQSAICAYWESLYYLLTALLAWKDFGKGLSWWYSVDKDDQKEPLFQFIKEIWDRDDQLDYFAAWAWTQIDVYTPDEISPAKICNMSKYRNENWWRNFIRKGRSFEHDPFYGGTNPLHLGHSQSFGYGDFSTGTPVLYFDAKQREASVTVGNFTTWRRDLASVGATLPSLNDRSWHVEVFDRQVGYLGQFRKSRVTGLWFMGRHSIHMRGQNVE